MYGTVAKMKVKPEAVKQLKSQIEQRQPKGFESIFVFQSDNDPNELWMIAIFDDKKTYFENAESPEQNEEYMELHKLMTAEPEWNDGEVVYHFTGDENKL